MLTGCVGVGVRDGVRGLSSFFFGLGDEGGEEVEGEFEWGSAERLASASVPKVCEAFVERNKSAYIYGRLRSPRALAFWRTVLNVSSVLMLWLVNGYPLPWASELRPEGERPNHKGTVGESKQFGSHEVFVDSAVEALTTNGAVVQCEREFLRLVSPLNVVGQKEKLRLIHDLSGLNDYLYWPKFKYESVAGLCDVLRPRDYMISIDLLSAYHHVAMAEDAWPYLGFQWKGKYYYFRVLPFGLGPAPYVFTKLFRPLVEYWRAKGIRTLPYLDDHVFGGQQDVPQTGSESILWVRALILSNLREAGWLVSASKAKLTPEQSIAHLGTIVNTVSGQFRVPLERLQRVQDQIRRAVAQGVVPIKRLSQIAGQIASFALAMGPVVKFYTRYMYFAIDDRSSWWQRVPTEGLLLRELQFWLGVSVWDYMQPIWPLVFKWSIKVNSDAGERGWGAALQGPNGVAEARGYMNLYERAQSSTWRELFAIYQTLKSFLGSVLLGCRVLQWCCDNQGAVFNMCRGGSRVPAIHDLCVQIFEMCEAAGIRVLWTWVPREQHDAQWADWLSKVFDKDDWMLHRGAFRACSAKWGVYTIDRFASDRNRLCALFNSYYWCPGTAGVDTFAQSDWLLHNNWCNPPFRMIGRLVAFLREVGASATVIVPCWRGSPWWTMLCPDGQHWASFVVDWFELEGSPLLFSSGHHSGNTTGCAMPGYRFFALRISFREDEREEHYGRVPSRCVQPRVCRCGFPHHQVVRASDWLRAEGV